MDDQTEQQIHLASAEPEQPKVERKEVGLIHRPLSIDPRSQAIVVRDNVELMRVIRIFAKGDAFPRCFDTDEKRIAAWHVAVGINPISPMLVLSNLCFINGVICCWGQIPKASAERTGQLEEYKLIFFDTAQKVINLENKNLDAPVWGAVTQMRRLKRSMNEYYFTEIEAKQAGLLSKSGPWKDYRKIMYARRTTGHGCKFEFPDAILGLPIAEYDYNQAPDLHDVTPSNQEGHADAVNQLNKASEA